MHNDCCEHNKRGCLYAVGKFYLDGGEPIEHVQHYADLEEARAALIALVTSTPAEKLVTVEPGRSSAGIEFALVYRPEEAIACDRS
jgi:hypothetical protein